MNLIINNHVIDSDLYTILDKIRIETNNRYLGRIVNHGDNIAISCPFHKDGMERHPSCFVYALNDNDNVPFGFFRCFTCGSQGQLYELVAYCFGCGIEEAKEWLIDNFSKTLTDSVISLPEITLTKEKKTYLNEDILNEYAYFHPYMFQRGLTENIIKKFKVGWDPKLDTITFPVWDENNNLLGITRRNVKNKYFHIPESIGKPVYLLNFVKRENITEVIVCESQIDALYCWSLGMPAVALLGTGTKKQYDILKNSGIRIFHLALDGDLAGKHGILRFIENMPNDIFMDIMLIPDGKDINDLSYEEIQNLKRVDKRDYLQNIIINI